MSTLLAPYTTLGVGGSARRCVIAEDEQTLVTTIAECDDRGEPVLLIAGGSNVVIDDSGFDGTVVLVRTSGVSSEVDSCSGVWLTVAAGQQWDELVAMAVRAHWAGIEALSGIPGSVGATPIQNVGAYGQQVSDVIARVRTWDRQRGVRRTFTAAECEFDYRTSVFRRDLTRYVILDVTMQLTLSATAAPVAYQDLAAALGGSTSERHPLDQVREAVLAIRRSKGMLLDPDDPDTASTGSFFTNPILTPAAADSLPPEAPRYPAGHGRVKTSAAWLIEHSGFGRGYGNDRAAISSKHTLALTNRGSAHAADVLALAREIRAGVQERFGVTLEPEPILVNCAL
jgi:UDP-N-acetylmuramate dehydrogenase